MMLNVLVVNTMRGLHSSLDSLVQFQALRLFRSNVRGQAPGTTNFQNISRRYSANSAGTTTTTTSYPYTVKMSNTSEPEESNSSSSSDENSNNGSKSKSTCIEEEVAKFRAMADSWWDPYGDFKPLHSLNGLRVSMIREGLVQSGVAKPEYVDGPRPLTGLKILDVGCGGGILCEPLARLGARVTGVDAAEENISVARLHGDQDPRVQHNLEYICGTVEEHVENIADKYDAVIASEVLEHVEATDYFIQACADTIKPGGSFFLTTINKTACAWVGTIAIAEYLLHLLPPGTHDWNKFIPLQDLLLMLEKICRLSTVDPWFTISSQCDQLCRCVTQMVHGMTYNPLINKWFWSSNTSVSYAVHAVKESHKMM
nr:ubiquinone biosynthesis O-methyltransferase-like isoform X2 [Cherax quadricarinatus]